MITPRHTCSFAGLELQPASISTRLGRDVAEHRPARGDGAQLTDRGRVPRRDTLVLPLTGTATEIVEQRDALVALQQGSAARLFVHPLDGQWMARLGELDDGLSAETATVTLTLVEDVPLSAATSDPLESASIQDVEALAEAYDQALEQLGPELGEAPTGAETLALCESWTDDSGHAQMRAELESFRATGASATETFRQKAGAAAHRAALALMELRGVVELYWLGVQRATAHHHRMTLQSAMPLAVWLTELYGAHDAALLYDEVVRLNHITNPLSLPEGAVLTLPRP